MLVQKQLEWIDSRLRQANPRRSHLLFGGIAIFLLGDLGQLPPVGGNPVWWKSNTVGASIYTKFTVVHVLSANMRINSANPQASRFQEILDHIYDGAVTEEDVREIRENCSKPTIEARKHGEWKRRGFDEMSTTHIYPRTFDVRRRNHEVLKASNSKIALIEAENSCSAARRMKSDDFMQLELQLYLADGATVMCMSNNLLEQVCAMAPSERSWIWCGPGDRLRQAYMLALLQMLTLQVRELLQELQTCGSLRKCQWRCQLHRHKLGLTTHLSL